MIIDKENPERWEDPIVAEVRAVRNAYAKRFNYDPDAIFQDLLKKQEDMKQQGYKFVSLPNKKMSKQVGQG